MRLLELAFVFALAHITKGQKYDDLAKDECFKNAYVCGDHRTSVTDRTGSLITEPFKFGEICRKHKEFLLCITQASLFCADNLTDFSRMLLDNRMSLKMFCTDLEWKRNYFRSAPCINRYEQEITDECRREEAERIDDRPWWCLIPEPCDAIRRVFHCSVQKMEQHCGTKAAEVYRRMHILKEENQDVVCEYRRRNPVYCRYRTTEKPNTTEFSASNQKESIKRMGSLSSSVSEAVNNIVQAVTVDIIGDLVTQSEVEDSDFSELKLDRLQSIIDKVKHVVDGENHRKTNTRNAETYSQKSVNSKDKSSSNLGDGKKLWQAFNLDSFKYTTKERKRMLSEICHSLEMPSSDRLQSIKGRKEDKSPNSETMSRENLPVEEKYIKDSILKLYELLKYEDAEIVRVDDGHMELQWRNLNDFPMKRLSCAWQNVAPERIFTCDIKIEYQSSRQNDRHPDVTDSNLEKQNIQSLEEPHVQDSLTYTEANLREAMEDGSTSQDAKRDIQFLADMFSTENPMLLEVSSISIPDVHRNGYKFIQTADPDNFGKETSSGEKGIAANSGSIDGESFILLDDSYYPIESDTVYISMGNAGYSTTETSLTPPESFSEKFESLDAQGEPEIKNIFKDCTLVEESKEEFQLRKLEDALSERFQSNDVVFELKELREGKTHKRPDSNIVHNYSNKECQTESFSTSNDVDLGDTQNYEPLILNGAAETYAAQKLQKSHTFLGTTSDSSSEGSIENKDRNTEALNVEISEGSTEIELNSMEMLNRNEL